MRTSSWNAFFLTLLAGSALAQTPVPAQLSPQAAYEAATLPVAIVHRSIGNWSDSETASLAVAIHNGAGECAARNATVYTGDALIAYARLCSLGLNWSAAGIAATQYIDSTDAVKPQLALAYGIKLEAALHANDVAEILSTAKAMLAANPYDETVDAAFNEAIDYLQLAYTDQALTLLKVRQPILLAALAADKSSLPRHTLYADGITLAVVQQYARLEKPAAATVVALDQALPATISGDETLMIASIRDTYGMLGKPLPNVHLQLSLADLKAPPPIHPDAALSTALLVFPKWCAQCVRMTMQEMANVRAALGKNQIRIYALLATPLQDAVDLIPQPVTPRRPGAKLAPAPAPPAGPPTAASLLLHTQTYVVSPETISLLHANDFPFLIVLDPQGIVRFAQPAPESALRPGEFATRAAEHVAEQWPERGTSAVIQ